MQSISNLPGSIFSRCVRSAVYRNIINIFVEKALLISDSGYYMAQQKKTSAGTKQVTQKLLQAIPNVEKCLQKLLALPEVEQVPVVVEHVLAHRDPGDRSDQRHAGVEERQRAATDRRHRRRAVGLHDVGDDAHGVGEVVLVGQNRHQCSSGEDSMTDLATTRATQEPDLAD